VARAPRALLKEILVALLGTRKTSFHARGIERRKRLLNSARVLLGTRALDEITLGDVAAHAKVPKGSAYFFYADIEDLYGSLLTLIQQELVDNLKRPIRSRIRSWQDVISAVNARGMEFYQHNPAAQQLQIGPKTSPELKLRDRQSDVAIGQIYEQHVEAFFELPALPDRSRVFFRAVEIADLMFGLSVLENGSITPAMCAEADRAAIGYLASYLPATLPKKKRKTNGD
jgi:AcrR family transcriptional regulator